MRALRPIAALLLLLACPLAASARQEAARTAEDYDNNRYELRYLDVHVAEAIAWDQCPEKALCKVAGAATGRGSILDVTAPPEIHAKLARIFAERDAAPLTRNFQLVLLAAGNKTNGPIPDLGAGPSKALNDIKGFLPFKHYRLLDTILVRLTQREMAQARLAGLVGNTYHLAMEFQAGGMEGDQLFLKFSLSGTTEMSLIGTSFSMRVGETVVVGTSSVAGSEEALVAILTALP